MHAYIYIYIYIYTFTLHARTHVRTYVCAILPLERVLALDGEPARARARAWRILGRAWRERVSKIEVHGAPHGVAETAVNNL